MLALALIITTPKIFGNKTITNHYWCVSEENWGREITWLTWRHHFKIAPFSRCLPSALKCKARVFKWFRFKKCLQNVPFSRPISVDGMPNRRSNTALSVKFLRQSLSKKTNWKILLTWLNGINLKLSHDQSKCHITRFSTLLWDLRLIYCYTGKLWTSIPV